MATKLDQAVSRVAIALGNGSWSAMTPVAIDAAASLTVTELGKLPDRWHPAHSANKAGVPELKESWDLLWFEATVEILAQRARDGLPGLLTLMDRNDSTYHQYVIVRLFRMAADGLERDLILERIRSRLETLRLPWVRFVVQEIEAWEPVDARPLQLLMTMSEIQIPGGEGDMISTHLRSMGPDRRAQL